MKNRNNAKNIRSECKSDTKDEVRNIAKKDPKNTNNKNCTNEGDIYRDY